MKCTNAAVLQLLGGNQRKNKRTENEINATLAIIPKAVRLVYI